MRFLIVSVFALMLSACVQTPTQNTQVVDDRPGLAFELASSAAEAYELKVDGVSYGHVGQYLAGDNRLRIIDGSHVVELENNGELVFTQEVYLGAGSNRILKVGNYE